MRKLVITFIAMTMLVLVGCGNNENEEQNNESVGDSEMKYDTIELDEVLTYEENGYKIVDVREVDEFEDGHIPTAVHLPLSAIEKEDYGDLDENGKYVIICRSGNRSQTASSLLIDAGFHAVNVKEGMLTWPGDVE